MKLSIRCPDLQAIDEHTAKSFPHESCGLLLGKFGKDAIEVEEAVQTENLLASPVAFEANAELVFKAIDRAERSGLELVGIYHSHPDLHAFVSARDAEFMKLWPGVAWLILGTSGKRVEERKAFVLEKEKVKELEIEVR